MTTPAPPPPPPPAGGGDPGGGAAPAPAPASAGILAPPAPSVPLALAMASSFPVVAAAANGSGGSASSAAPPLPPLALPPLPLPPACSARLPASLVAAVPPSVALEAHVHASLLPAGLSAPSSSAAMHPTHNPSMGDLWTPEVFRNRRLRSGKWIREEEVYAEALIDLFEKGLASDCTSGCTLRSYLSKKLHCAPMRISKKYAGKGIGKMAFVPQGALEASSSSTSSVALSEEEARLREEQVQKKAEAFYLAVFQCNEYLGVPLGFLFGNPPDNPAVAAAAIAPAPTPLPAAFPAVGQPYASSTAPAGAAFPLSTATSTTTSSSMPPPPHPSFQTLPPLQAARTPAPWHPPVGAGPVAATPPAALQLHQTYLCALQQQQHQQQLQLNNQQQGPAQAQTHHLAPQGMNGVAVPWPPSTANPPAASGTPAPPPAAVAGVKPPPTSTPAVDPLQDLASHQAPDFLTGFDRVALSLKPATGGATTAGHDGATTCDQHNKAPAAGPSSQADPSSLLHCSPTFTSRSFDDFHRFLGQDLVSLDSPYHKPRSGNNGGTAVAHALTAPAFPVHDLNGSSANKAPHSAAASTVIHGARPASSVAASGASAGARQPLLVRGNSSEAHSLFCTESYAVFASAAVAASSQHAAYLLGPGAVPGLLGPAGVGSHHHHPTAGTTRQRSDTFDVETTMDLVSAHLQQPRQPPSQQQRRASHDSHGTALSSTPMERTRTHNCSSVTFPKTRESLLERMYGPRLANLVSGSEPSTTSSSGAENESGQEGSSGPSSASSGAASESDDVHTDHSHSDEPSSDSDHTGDSEYDEATQQQQQQQHHQQHHVPKCKKAKISSSHPDAAAAAAAVEQTAYGE